MLGSRLFLTSAAISSVAWAGYLPEPAHDPQFRYKALKRAENVTSFNGPYSTRGRDIVDARGEKVTWAGVNWPMSGTVPDPPQGAKLTSSPGETMVPEGLEWASAEEILDDILGVGFNYIRMYVGSSPQDVC